MLDFTFHYQEFIKCLLKYLRSTQKCSQRQQELWLILKAFRVMFIIFPPFFLLKCFSLIHDFMNKQQT